MTDALNEVELSLIKGIDAAVEREGEDYIYENDECMYYANGGPSCIVGHAIMATDPGVKGTLLARNTAAAFALIPNLFPSVRREVTEALQAAQDEQDARHPWGFAQDAMHAVLRRHGLEPVS